MLFLSKKRASSIKLYHHSNVCQNFKQFSFVVIWERKYYHKENIRYLYHMIDREYIIRTATKLFIQYGVKAVTVDRLVGELHTSKRTLYSHFEDKTALLKACLQDYHVRVSAENAEVIQQADNAIEAMAHLHHRIVHRASMVNPNFFNDILKYHPGLLHASYRKAGNFAHNQLLELAKWGIEDGFFQKDLDLDVTVKTVLSLLKLLKNNDLFPIDQYSKERLTFGVMLPYLRGVCTAKGLEALEKQEELFRVRI